VTEVERARRAPALIQLTVGPFVGVIPLLFLVYASHFPWPLALLIAGLLSQISINRIWSGMEQERLAEARRSPSRPVPPEVLERRRLIAELRVAVDAELPWLDFAEGDVLSPAEAKARLEELELIEATGREAGTGSPTGKARREVEAAPRGAEANKVTRENLVATRPPVARPLSLDPDLLDAHLRRLAAERARSKWAREWAEVGQPRWAYEVHAAELPEPIQLYSTTGERVYSSHVPEPSPPAEAAQRRAPHVIRREIEMVQEGLRKGYISPSYARQLTEEFSAELVAAEEREQP
jgi:hypothetical protein